MSMKNLDTLVLMLGIWELLNLHKQTTKIFNDQRNSERYYAQILPTTDSIVKHISDVYEDPYGYSQGF